MRHLKAYRKLNRTSSHRSLMLRNLVTSLLEHERVETTVVKAKEARRIAERMITLGKQGTLHARRRAASVLMKKSVVKKLFDELAPRYVDREGGYTRILRVGYRKGDGAPLAFLELVTEELEKKKGKKKSSQKKVAAKGKKERRKGVSELKTAKKEEKAVTSSQAKSEEEPQKKEEAEELQPDSTSDDSETPAKVEEEPKKD